MILGPRTCHNANIIHNYFPPFLYLIRRMINTKLCIKYPTLIKFSSALQPFFITANLLYLALIPLMNPDLSQFNHLIFEKSSFCFISYNFMPLHRINTSSRSLHTNIFLRKYLASIYIAFCNNTLSRN